jgi:hypothetical protein
MQDDIHYLHGEQWIWPLHTLPNEAIFKRLLENSMIQDMMIIIIITTMTK